ncbi:DUF3040 domain-containing protein [Pseudoclavibacter soli]|uniref:DUF3040 domain-containing protein n=1 Tax=Pseudoclavibacter soli TaxID=452623 RepID=UPI00042306BA|nr:DUF3040 domain-containing protein [Pseudoclavibacter soli]
MPLSENEQRLLEEMERNLYRTESDEVSTSSHGRTWDRRAVVVGALGVVGGFALLLLAVSMKLVIVGVLGFLVVVGGVVWATRRIDDAQQDQHLNGAAPRKHAPSSSNSVFDRLEQRWNDRRND